MIEHPRLRRHMVVGGHVEPDETQAEAAPREATEESGLRVRLLAWPSPAQPAGTTHAPVPQPWWITQMAVPADNHLDEPHVHVDHQYVAIADSPVRVRDPAHPFGWYSGEELDALMMFPDTLLQAKTLLSLMGAVLTAAERDNAAMLRVLTAAGLS
ncbi:MAG: NUDIX domain-containing protein [Pseudonocardiales bacterium]|nr:NUDIX domain-containing protein [Pseudonocardiales bacterium]